MTGISAIVATYHRKEELERLFNSILINNIKEIEIILVDQNEQDLLEEVVKRFSSLLPIIHIKSKEPNQSKARNLGASYAKYPIICFPDDDCWFENNALRTVQAYFSADPKTDLLVINWKQNPHEKITLPIRLTKSKMFSFRSVGYVTYVLFFKTSVFLELGGFIEDIGIGQYIGGGEDSELAFRAISRNLKIFFRPDVYVNHNYVPIYSRPLPILRARQRAMGLMYSMYDIPKYVIARGFLSPIVKMLFAFNLKKSQQHYHLFCGRVEGYQYGKKHKDELYVKNSLPNKKTID